MTQDVDTAGFINDKRRSWSSAQGLETRYELELRRKRETFRQETTTRQTTQLTIISASGLRQNAHSWDVANVVKGSDLFVF